MLLAPTAATSGCGGGDIGGVEGISKFAPEEEALGYSETPIEDSEARDVEAEDISGGGVGGGVGFTSGPKIFSRLRVVDVLFGITEDIPTVTNVFKLPLVYGSRCRFPHVDGLRVLGSESSRERS